MPYLDGVSERRKASDSRKSKGFLWFIKRYGVGYSMLLPFVLLFFAFVVLPVFIAFGLSFTNYNMFRAPSFVGLAELPAAAGRGQNFLDRHAQYDDFCGDCGSARVFLQLFFRLGAQSAEIPQCVCPDLLCAVHMLGCGDQRRVAVLLFLRPLRPYQQRADHHGLSG